MLETEKDLDMRIELVVSLGLLGEKSGAVIEALVKLLSDPEDELRRRAAPHLWALSEPRPAPAADALFKVAGGEKVKDIRVDAVRAFGSALGQGLKGRVKDILTILSDREYEVRLAVVEEVGALGNELRG